MRWDREILLTINSEYLLYNGFGILVIGILCLLIIIVVAHKTKDVSSYWWLSLGFIYHTLFSIYYCYSSTYNPDADTQDFFMVAASSSSLLENYGYGLDFVVMTLYPFIKVFKMTYFTCFLVHNMIGFLGISLIFLTMWEQYQSHKNYKWVLLIPLFWPSLNFWTSMIGKDSIIIMALGMLMFAISNFDNRKVLLLLSLLLIGHVRPHMAMMIIPCLVITMITSSGNVSPYKRAVMSFILIASLFAVYGVFLDLLKTESLDLSTAESIIENRQNNWGGGSSVGMGSANIVQRVFTYLYRPLFVDAYSFEMVMASFENIVLILITLTMLTPRFLSYVFKTKSYLVRFNTLYFFIVTVFLAAATPNMGTAARQKNMVIIGFFILFHMYISQMRRTNYVTRNRIHSIQSICYSEKKSV